jgi:NADPH2:quinone reductase
MAGHVFAALRDGILKPDVRRRYPLAAAAAHRDLEARRTTGQIVLLA